MAKTGSLNQIKNYTSPARKEVHMPFPPRAGTSMNKALDKLLANDSVLETEHTEYADVPEPWTVYSDLSNVRRCAP